MAGLPGAREYLRQLQEELHEEWEARPEEENAARLRDVEEYRSGLMGQRIDLAQLDADLTEAHGEPPPRHSNAAFRDYMLRHIYLPSMAEVLPEDLRSEFSSLVFGWLPTRETNALSLQAPNGEPLAVLDNGLAMILSHWVEVIAVMSLTRGAAGDELLQREAREIIRYFLAGGARGIGRLYHPLTVEQMGMIAGLTIAMEQFVLMHEFAHVHAGHLDGCMTAPITIGDSGIEVSKFTTDEQQELEADALAYGWLCGFTSLGPVGPCFQPFLRMMVLWFFDVVHMVEQHLPASLPRTHPPAMVRVEAIAERYAGQLSAAEKRVMAEHVALVRRDLTFAV